MQKLCDDGDPSVVFVGFLGARGCVGVLGVEGKAGSAYPAVRTGLSVLLSHVAVSFRGSAGCRLSGGVGKHSDELTNKRRIGRRHIASAVLCEGMVMVPRGLCAHLLPETVSPSGA